MRKSLNKVNETPINCLIWHFCLLSPDFYFPFQTVSPEKRDTEDGFPDPGSPSSRLGDYTATITPRYEQSLSPKMASNPACTVL